MGAGGLLVALVAPGVAAADPNPEAITITAIGSGCPKGTVQTFVAPDNSAFALEFEGGATPPFATTVDATHPIARKNCQASITITPPAGWQFSLGSVFVGGSASLADGATALSKTLYYWQGKSPTLTTTTDLTGSNGDWAASQSVDPDEFGWSQCGRPGVVNVNSTLQARQADADPSSSSVVVESTEFFYNLAWQPCTP
jgi:hypothetical protein